MIIILEGPDGAGKSTLGEKISRQTGYQLIHMDRPRTEEEKAKMADNYMALIRTGKNIVLDRAWYSDMVYGPIMRNETSITYPQMYELERALAKVGAILIYCTAPTQVLWKRCLSRGEDYITDSNKFKQICGMYDILMHAVPHYIPVTAYEYDNL